MEVKHLSWQPQCCLGLKLSNELVTWSPLIDLVNLCHQQSGIKRHNLSRNSYDNNPEKQLLCPHNGKNMSPGYCPFTNGEMEHPYPQEVSWTQLKKGKQEKDPLWARGRQGVWRMSAVMSNNSLSCPAPNLPVPVKMSRNFSFFLSLPNLVLEKVRKSLHWLSQAPSWQIFISLWLPHSSRQRASTLTRYTLLFQDWPSLE